ncbi:acetyl-CoA carboxylase biotin carboxylase subunit, partial [bacterium]|nr:acetyl-CoA carboxylase biotin carboxylase subunit [candidate division CSSED10-310 bacterium]
MLGKILIANRGEIALRIIRACKELRIKTVAVYSEADAATLPVRFADEAVCIGPTDHFQSYLNEANILSAAEITGAEAIHPGYGYLAESAHFAEVCEACGIIFIGPTPEHIRTMGDKVKARELAGAAGIPVIEGSSVAIASLAHGLSEARRIGYPLMLKAAAGGGGRGIRIINDERELKESIELAKAEAMGYFGSGDIYLERFLAGARHIEFQIFGDSHGNIVQYGERDCTIQRRHQKLVEEAPSCILDDTLRDAMGAAAIHIARLIRYENAGTIEFLLTRSNDFYFM